MPKINIDNKDVEFENGMSVMQACEQAGFEIPRFCYHEKLSIAGNCRMCLVEMEKSPKPIASCAMPASEGMNIKTNTKFVEKAKEYDLWSVVRNSTSWRESFNTNENVLNIINIGKDIITKNAIIAKKSGPNLPTINRHPIIIAINITNNVYDLIL